MLPLVISLAVFITPSASYLGLIPGTDTEYIYDKRQIGEALSLPTCPDIGLLVAIYGDLDTCYYVSPFDLDKIPVAEFPPEA